MASGVFPSLAQAAGPTASGARRDVRTGQSNAAMGGKASASAALREGPEREAGSRRAHKPALMKAIARFIEETGIGVGELVTALDLDANLLRNRQEITV